MNISSYNRKAWDRQDEPGSEYNIWTRMVSQEQIEQAKKGNWQIIVTPNKPVPRKWLGNLKGKNVLCLASGGGQQGPILAAAGADVVVFDNSPKQLEKDLFVAKRDNLKIKTELGDIRDLSGFKDEQFDIIINMGIGHVENIQKIWHETYRILKQEGSIISGLANPIEYVFDLKAWNNGKLIPRHKIPYSDARDLSPAEQNELIISKNLPMFFGYTLEAQIQGQIKEGFVIAGFYDDGVDDGSPLAKYINYYFATLSIKHKM